MGKSVRMGYLTHPNGGKILPITHVGLVIDSEGISLQTIIEKIESANNIYSFKTYAEMMAMDTTDVKRGSIGYVITKDKYYSFKNDTWAVMETDCNCVWIGDTPPKDKKSLWIDTRLINANPNDISTFPPIILHLVNTIGGLNNTVLELTNKIKKLEDELEEILENGIIGDNNNKKNKYILKI